jgi:hypothetical protein
VGRTIALFVGLFALANLILPGSENLWWIDQRPLPSLLLALPAGLLVFHAIRPNRARLAVRIAVLALMAIVALNAVTYYLVDIGRGVPVPFSLVVLGALALILRAPRTSWPRFEVAATACVLVVGLPLFQVLFFGTTDYARPADLIVVPGARVYADGRLSWSLEERVVTAVRLYHEGLAPRLLFSGGPGDGEIHETEAMRARAVEMGVPPEAIELDREGLDTRATVAHTGEGRALVVSQFYHLPRIRLAYRRAGREVWTVPADAPRFYPGLPLTVLREVPAFWFYYMNI